MPPAKFTRKGEPTTSSNQPCQPYGCGVSICGLRWCGSIQGRKQWLRKSNRDSEVRSSETFQDRIRNTDNFALAIEERSARTSRGGLRVEDDFVGQDVSNVALRNNRVNEIATCQLRQDSRDVAATLNQYLLGRGFVGARK